MNGDKMYMVRLALLIVNLGTELIIEFTISYH